MAVKMSENLTEQVIRPSYEQIVGSIRHSGVQEILRRAQEVEDEITEQEQESQPLRKTGTPRSLKDITKAKPRRRAPWK